MMAAIEVLRLAPRTTELQLCVASQLVTDGATLWLGGWRTKKGQTIKNVDLWQQMDEELQKRQAAQEWVKVPSHVDLEGNEHADKLADEGVRKHGVRLEADEKEKRPAAKRPERQQQQPEQPAIARGGEGKGKGKHSNQTQTQTRNQTHSTPRPTYLNRSTKPHPPV